MRKGKKLACLFMTGLMAASAVTACTNEPAPAASNAPEGETTTGKAAEKTTEKASADQITLRFMWWGGDARNEATLAVIDQYEKLHPEVKIEAEMNSDQGYIDKVSTMLANGTAPDILQQNVDSLPDFISRASKWAAF